MLLDCLLNNYNGYDCFCNSFAFNLYDHSSFYQDYLAVPSRWTQHTVAEAEQHLAYILHCMLQPYICLEVVPLMILTHPHGLAHGGGGGRPGKERKILALLILPPSY